MRNSSQNISKKSMNKTRHNSISKQNEKVFPFLTKQNRNTSNLMNQKKKTFFEEYQKSSLIHL